MNHLKVTNTFFKKRDINKYTWTARGQRLMIDYFLINDKLRPQMKDVHVYRGCDIGSDHYILIAEFKRWSKWRKLRTRQRVTQDEVYKVYLLQDESIKDLYQRRLEKYLLETTTEEVLEDEWQKVQNYIYKAVDEVLGKKIRSKKGLRIWNEEIEKAIKE